MEFEEDIDGDGVRDFYVKDTGPEVSDVIISGATGKPLSDLLFSSNQIIALSIQSERGIETLLHVGYAYRPSDRTGHESVILRYDAASDKMTIFDEVHDPADPESVGPGQRRPSHFERAAMTIEKLGDPRGSPRVYGLPGLRNPRGVPHGWDLILPAMYYSETVFYSHNWLEKGVEEGWIDVVISHDPPGEFTP